jgi:hypothetical protein
LYEIVSCSLVEVYRRFKGGCCLQHQAMRHPHFRRRENLKSRIINLIKLGFGMWIVFKYVRRGTDGGLL